MAHDQTYEVVAELVEALIETTPTGKARHPAVAVGLAWLRKHEAAQVAVLPGWVKKKACYNCNDEIFFAARRHLSKADQKIWVPMIPYPITSATVVLDAVCVKFEGTNVWIEDPSPGVQWMPHRVLCGRRDRPIDPDLAVLWDKTTGKARIEEDDAVAKLLDILGDTE